MSNQRFVSVLLAILTLILVPLDATSVLGQKSSNVVGRKVYRSPDRSLVATVISLKQRYYGEPPSLVEIRRSNGHLLARKDYSPFRGQGYTVLKAGWTADSHFFVYSTMSSGGHGPWHQPVFFYSRSRHSLYSLDEALNANLAGEQLKFRKPCVVVTRGYYWGKSLSWLDVRKDLSNPNGERILTIRLRRLEPHLTDESADASPY